MHNIEYYHYMENINRDYVQRELDHFVAVQDWQEGSTGLGRTIRWLENVGICETEEAAEEMIKKLDKGWYDCLAVRYYEPVRSNDKGEQTLRSKCLELHDAYLKKDRVLYPQSVTSDFIGCKSCGSRLRREKLIKNFCPVCNADFRPESTKKAIASAKEHWNKAEDKLKEYIKTHSKKTVKWLVKIEYHT